MHKLFLLTVTFLTTWTAAQHNPLKNPHICGIPSCKGNGKFKYGPGTQQNYKYSVQVNSFFNGTSRTESSFYVEGIARLAFLTTCDGLLTLSDIKLSDNIPGDDSKNTEHINSQLFAQEMTTYPLRFSFKDGIISELCPRDQENEWVLNFKRGILTMLHNSMKRFDLDYSNDQENDIRGKCPTKYRVIGAKETSLVIEKFKDLDRCEKKSKLHSMVQTYPTSSFKPNLRSDSILKSSSHCTLSIDHNIYNEITCEENYMVQPFSNNGMGASSIITQRLILIEETSDVINEEFEISRRVPLQFDHYISSKSKIDDISSSVELIKKLCKQNKMQDRTFLANLYSQLINNLRQLSDSAMKTLHKQTSSTCPTGKKHFLDVLPFVNSDASVDLMKDIILSNSVPDTTVNEWMVLIAFIPTPDDAMMETVSTLLEKKTFSVNVALSIASLTHTYCIQNSNCKSNSAVISIVHYLENHFLQMYQQNHFDRSIHDNMIGTLKALSNIGVISDDFQIEVLKVIKNSNLDVTIRLAAIEIFRRSVCQDTRIHFEQIYRDQDEDAEVRIAAYLQIMRCPNYLLIRNIKHTLLNEEVNQVGSFVWTHLSNIIKTGVPSKVEIQSLLSEKDLIKKFSSDVRKFSHNSERSVYFDEYNFGGNYESNIIFSPSSYIPKSANFNVTVDIFGESVNIFEVYCRMDNFEHYLESLFGAKGTPNNLDENTSTPVKDNIIDRIRWLRSANEKDIVKTEVDKLPNVMRATDNEPKVAMGLKVFGNDVKYVTYHGQTELRSAVETFNPIYHLKRLLSGKEINYSKAAMFLDSKYVTSTGAGLPLSLMLTGTAFVNIKLYGSLGAAKVSKERKLEMDLTADIQPTVSLDITGELSVDATYTNSGIKLKSNVYTDTAIKGDIKIRGTELVSVKFSLPRKKNEIMVASSELLIKENGIYQQLEEPSKKHISNSICSWPMLDETVGLKLCTEYNFINVTDIENNPYIIMAGPAKFRSYLHKSDPTANIYLFEYKWIHRRDSSIISLTFDTPGSTLKRLVSVNLTIDRQSQNLTLMLQSSNSTILAKGKYKNMPAEKLFQVALDINNKKHFDATVSLLREQIKNGFSYKPTIYLGVNDERVVKFSGFVELMSKKGISQYTVDLRFETKRLFSRLYGYISKSATSLEASLFNDYKFQNTKEQRVVLKFGVANRSRKNLVVFLGFFNLYSTAYPNLNIAANSTFQKSGAHMDLIVKLIQNPLGQENTEVEAYPLNFDLKISYKSFTDNKRILKIVSSIDKKSSNLALKGEFIYETYRHDMNIAAVVNYGYNKEVSVMIFWSHPRSTLEEIKTHVNITIPSFTPMILKLEIDEKQPKDYMINCRGTWFSGHSISAIGFYQDKSTSHSSNRHLKFFIKSPSFKDLNIDLQYYRVNEMLKLDVKGLYDNMGDYNLYLKYQTVSAEETKSQLRIKYKNKLYNFNSSIYDSDHKKIIAELHIDQLRDIVFIAHAHNLQDNKGLGIEVNWDANRDPTQKLIISALYKKLAPFNNLANFMIMYPGRFIKGDYNFIFQDQHLNTLASISWNGGTFGINMDLLYKSSNGYYIEISSQIVTPFNKWNRVKLDGKFEHLNNKYDFHGVVSWSKHERVAIGVFGDYVSNPSRFKCKYSCSIDSSFDRIPSINTTISHGQNETNFDTNLYVKYNPDFVIGVDSHWKIDSDDSSTNLTGTVHSRSPFKGLDKGIFFGKIFVKNMTYLKGVAQVDVDHKKLTINMEGHFKKITNCMLIVNITAPEDDYQLRLITSTEKRHFVALLTYPTGNFGTEILLSISSITSFDIKLHLATPVEFLQDIIIIAKLKPTEADFRAGWNFLLLGFSGIWHYANATDFKYLYKIYTPVDDFEENGVVGKLLLTEGLDFEISIKLSHYKLGIRLLGQSKPTHFDELDLKIKNIYLGLKLSEVGENDHGDPLNWVGLVELDIIVYPTIKGKVEIDQKGSSYILQSKLTTPHGVALIFDEFIYMNIFNIKNSMQISTPYQQMKRITSDFELTIQKGTIYVFGLDFDYQNQTQLVQNGIWVKYFTESKEPEVRNYNLTLEVNTLLKAFPKLNVFGTFETEENFYHTKLLLNTNGGDVLVDATIEIDGGLMELTSSFHVKTPFIYIPSSQLRLSKLFSVSNNYLEVELNMVEKLKRNIYMKTSWLVESQKQFFTVFQLETPFAGLENTTAGIDLQISNLTSKAWIAIQLNPLEIEINSTLMDDILTATSDLNFNGRRFPLYLECKILTPSKFRKEFDGYLKLEKKLFRISGNVVSIGILPANVSITFTPDDKSASMIFEYQLFSPAINNYDIVGRIQLSNRLTTFQIHLVTTDKWNWELHLWAISPNEERFMVNCQANSEGHIANLIVNAETPIPKLEKPRAGLTYNSEQTKSLIGFFELTEAKGKMKLDLLWNFLEDMLVKIKGNYQNQYYSSESSVEAFYKNPQKLFLLLEVGGDIKIDRLWNAGSNLTVRLPLENHLGLEAHLKHPDDNETHSIFGNLNFTESLRKIESFLKYRTLHSMKRYGSGIQISSIDRHNLSGNIDLEWNSKKFDSFANLQMLDDKMDFIYSLKTPKFADKQLLVTKINYKTLGDHHNVTYETFYPEDRSVAYATVDYKELANMNGIFNLTVPYKSLKYTGAYFKTETNPVIHNRYIKLFWNDDNAVLDSKCNIRSGHSSNERYINGKILIELPLTTRHLAMVDYEYEQKDIVKNGHALVTYNGSTVLLTKYKGLSLSSPGFDKDTINVEIQNNIIPVGATYVHEQKYDADSIAPEMDNKFLYMYHLQNKTKFNVTGELSVQTTITGQKYILTAIHSNRTIKLWTEYDVLDKEYKQHSRIQLSPSNWLEYDINLLNRTLDEIFDAQQAVIKVIYPKRSFTAQGFYNISDSMVSTDVSLVWDKNNRSVEAGLDWRRVSAYREQLSLEIKHPSLEKVISFYSEYGYNKSQVDGHLVVDYSLNPDQKLTLCGKVQDNSNPWKYNYTYNIWAEHNATTLHLKSGGEFYWNPSTIGMHHTTKYQRSYLPLSTSEALARVNLDNKEIELKKNNIASGLFYAYGVYGGHYPIYTANVSAIQGLNDTKGEFYINFKEKLSYFNFNLTEDGSQSFHMYGFIPDARSAVFDIRRDYDDKSISDVSSYVQLNHSRLIMSSLRWRPELTSDVQSGLREYIAQFYLETLEGINNTKQYVKAETLDAINGIWADAKPLVEELLNDLRNLTVIEEDIEEFKVFLNNSYHANEFYIKTLSDIVVTMFDELALKSHLQNFPEIVQEIWSVMGESGQKIKKSILWVLEKIRTYYKNTTEFIHGLIKGDPIEHITSGLEKLVERYDEFMKGVHVSMIQYIESLWSQTYIFIVEYWHKTLAALEPAFLKFIHYLESIVWSTGKELLDFLYQRKNEIIESPYFVQFTKFSHDVDTFYKDITGNNTIASIYKYSVVAWSFLKEKYLSLIPFGKEIMDVINEIVTELKQIGEIPSIKFMVIKFNEAYGYIEYYYDHFDIENRIHELLSLIYMKFSEMYVTAIEVENRQRIAKTKFIFEPNDGIMLLEQKLPMPWHAFNQTPNFREIPEIKRIYNILSYLEASHISFWNIYYDFKPYMDLSDWLPPFKGQAMLMGSKYYVTFDKRFYKFEGSCTYLLAKDFIDGNFTLMVSYDTNGNTDELLLLLNGTLVRVNMINDIIHLDGQHTERLPLQIGRSYLYRDSGFFVLKSELGYILECNMKFKICTFEISGWYSGKTAGLWGTFNNEPSDDFMTSTKLKSTNSNLDMFGDSWALNGTCSSKFSNAKESKPISNVISSMCEEFFTSKVSQLSTCFSRVPKDNFLTMCLSSASEREACISVISYINLCAYDNVPLRIPDTCVKCNLLNGTEINEGSCNQLQGDDVPKTADIIFIVEAKKCNKQLNTARNFGDFIVLLEKELTANQMTNSRYAVVTFGGDGVWDQPRSVVVNGKIFTDYKSIPHYFDMIPAGDGNKDIFSAIMFAYNLISRPGVSKNFVLIPCSECATNEMEYDYSTIHQLLSESAISLHILMNDIFSIQKGREMKVPFGIDTRFAYTKKDVRGLVGDQPLRKSITLPKSTLGFCLPLAIETNGTVFSAKYLETDKKNAKKFATVFAKVVSRSATPRQCMECECTGSDFGISYMECYLCTTSNLTRNNFEVLGLDDEESYNINLFDGFNF